MGQFYRVVILSDNKYNGKEKIRLWMCPSSYKYVGLKLTEHSYIDNIFVQVLEYLISVDGMFHISRIVWCGDYADKEENDENNLYGLVKNDGTFYCASPRDTTKYRYIVNHTKKLYVDKLSCKTIHPLPLLVCESNGYGGGDYYGNNKELCGTWARNHISMEKIIPDGFTELVCNFYEDEN